MFLSGSRSVPVHESFGHLHGLILGQGDAAAHALVVLIPVPHIDLWLAAVPCDYVDLLGPFLVSAPDLTENSDVFHDVVSDLVVSVVRHS